MDKDKTIVDHGLILNPIVENDHYVLGGYGDDKFPTEVLQKDGHGWRKFRPITEIQKRLGLETLACTVFGTQNALEALAKRLELLDFPKDCAERYNAILAGLTGIVGADPHNVAESFRNFGVVVQGLLPWTDDIDTREEWFSPNPMDENMVKEGQKIVRKYKILHKWLFNGLTVKGKSGKLITGLSVGTVCVSVKAWKKKNGRYWKNANEGDNHWLWLMDYKQGEYWLVYDHYDDVEKKLVWDYNFAAAKVYAIVPRDPNDPFVPFGDKPSWFTPFFNFFTSMISSLWK